VLACGSPAPVPTAPAQAGVEAPPAPEPPPAPRTAALVDHVSYSALEDYRRCGYRFYLQRALRLPARELPGAAPPRAGAAGEGPPALLRGTVVHELLERLDFAAPAAIAPAEVQALATAHGGALTGADAEEIVALVQRFAASALCARLAAAGDPRREAPFAFPLEIPAAEPPLVTGVVDAMARTGDLALIIDYKSDRVGDVALEPLVERAYGTQRLIYALAALRAGAAAVEVVHCFLERPGEPITARFERSQTPALEHELAALVRGIRDERFEVSAAPNRELCVGCPGRGTLCTWDVEATLRDPAAAAAPR
jgi:ATP-dependent exoDNAse (exonuclease V) beta subunit